MKKPTHSRKLSLNATTVRTLERSALDSIAGGRLAVSNNVTCQCTRDCPPTD